jgi:hypothetical protein
VCSPHLCGEGGSRALIHLSRSSIHCLRGTKRRFHLISHGTVYLNLPACLLDCGRIALTIQCAILYGATTGHAARTVFHIPAALLLVATMDAAASLPMPDDFFYLRMSSYIWQSGQRRLLAVPIPHQLTPTVRSFSSFPLLGTSSSLRRRRPLKLPFRD